MKIYHYSRKIQEYIGPADARLDPKEAEIGKEKYLIPAYTTTIKPPVIKKKQVATFDLSTKAWKLFPDHRGDFDYDPDNGQKRNITEINVVPDITDPPSKDLIVPKWDAQALNWIENVDKEVFEYQVAYLRSLVANASGLTIEAKLIQDLQDAEDKLLKL